MLSPVVIAIWQPMAEALGFGRKPVGWKDVLDLARDPARLVEPRAAASAGAFRFGHTHPEYEQQRPDRAPRRDLRRGRQGARASRSQDVARPDVARARRRHRERRSCTTAARPASSARKMFERGPSYLSAAVLYESMVIESYDPKYRLPFPLVAIYPKEGSFWSDHPIGVVEREWVSAGAPRGGASLHPLPARARRSRSARCRTASVRRRWTSRSAPRSTRRTASIRRSRRRRSRCPRPT